MNKWDIDFISEEDFKNHIKQTILHYGDKLKNIDLKGFNKNIVDPIKLIFDKNVYSMSWEDIIQGEILRQRDKSNNNEIGYFHQNIFRYIKNCEVLKIGFDVIYRKYFEIDDIKGENLYIEIKNKHNTMNSSASQKTYMNMQNKLLEEPDSICALVEIIAKHSQNIEWQVSLNEKSIHNKRIRRISIDKLYEIITGDKNAFFKLCNILPNKIQEVLKEIKVKKCQNDSAINELLKKAKKFDSFELALYMLSFSEYNGFLK